MTVGMGPAFWQIRDEGDPYADDVIAHLWFDGDYTDRSQFALGYVLQYGATFGSGQVKFGTQSLDNRFYTVFPGVYAAGCAGNGVNLSPGNVEFCVEFWYYEPPVGSSGNNGHFLFQNNSNLHVFRIYSPSFKGDIAFDVQGGPDSGPVSVTRSAWHHVALTRLNNTYDMYIDGVKVKTVTNSVLNTGTHLSNSCSIYIGCHSSIGSSFGWYVSNFRFTKKQRYSSNFSVPTAPFPDPVP
jgi:Concanavalin A-like lectin/glucanases superfamily